jgi:hypothetical protein
MMDGTKESSGGRDDKRNTAEAGIARGAVRAMSKSATRATAQFPSIGSLPRPMPAKIVVPKAAPGVGVVMPRKLPVRQVAKVSDRVSQGLDLYDLATTKSPSNVSESKFSKFRNFATSTYTVLRAVRLISATSSFGGRIRIRSRQEYALGNGSLSNV